MLRLLILFAAIACAWGAAIPKGMMPQFDGRIVDGVPTSITSFPWQVSLQRNGFHFCGGSIYSRQIVVTAAHCFIDLPLSALRIRAGSSFWISGGILTKAAAYKQHEDFNIFTLTSDVAVIRLSSALTFSPTIKPISLARIVPKTGAAAAVSGWGATKYNSESNPTQLKYVDVAIVGQAECASSAYGYGSKIDKNMICSYNINKDSCQGDSGGALVSGGVQVGIVSWGNECASPKYPGVYTNVAALHKWITTNADSI